MLESLRAAQNTWVGKAVLAIIFLLIIVGLSFFGIADLFRSRTSTWAASVGSTEVSAEAFRQAYFEGLQQLQQRLRRQVTGAQARQLGLEQQVLSRLVSDALLDREAGRLGLAISDPQVGRLVVEDPTFANAEGRFDQAKFTTFLGNNRLTEQGFARQQRSGYLRQELIDGVAGSLAAPRAAVEALHRLQTETRSLDAIVLPPSLVGDIPAADDATLQSYFDAHKARFGAPEYRKLTLLAVTPATVAKPDQVSPDDIAKAYDQAPEARFGAPERRTLQQIVFPTQTEAEAAALRIATGTAFGEIASERKVADKDLDLGTVSKAQIFDKPVAEAAFALPDGGSSQPVQGTFGTVLVHVTAIQAGDRKPLDQVAPVLRQELAEAPARTRDALRDIRDKIEDERTSGKPLAEAAKAVGLDVRTFDAVDATGHDKSGAAIDIPDREQVVRAAFASDVGVDNDVIQTREGHQIWFEVGGVEPAHQRTFAEVKSEVETAWHKDETAKRLEARAADLVKALAEGTSVEQVAVNAGNLPVKHVADARRSGGTDLASAVVLKVFDTPTNGAGMAQGDDGSLVVFKVLDSVVPPLDAEDPQTKQLERQYTAYLSEDLLTAYLTRLQGSVAVKINPEVLQSVVGASS